jgi:hypothetical protein
VTRLFDVTMDWEIELAAVIGRAAKNAPPETALDTVAGHTIANDLSARDMGRRPQMSDASPFKYDWVAHKNFGVPEARRRSEAVDRAYRHADQLDGVTVAAKGGGALMQHRPARRHGIPATAEPIVHSYREVETMKANPHYAAAKAGMPKRHGSWSNRP